MAVSYTWFANANVTLNTQVVKVPSLNTSLIIGIFPDQHIGGGNYGRAEIYQDKESFYNDFKDIILTETNQTQKQRYNDLLTAVNCFFTQVDVTQYPDKLIVGRLDPQEIINTFLDPLALNAAFLSLKKDFPSWYGFTIVDNNYLDAPNSASYSIYTQYVTAIATSLNYIQSLNYKCIYFENTKDFNVYANMTAKATVTTYAPAYIITSKTKENVSLPDNQGIRRFKVESSNYISIRNIILLGEELMCLYYVSDLDRPTYSLRLIGDSATGNINGKTSQTYTNGTILSNVSFLQTSISPTNTTIVINATSHWFLYNILSQNKLTLLFGDQQTGEMINFTSVSEQIIDSPYTFPADAEYVNRGKKIQYTCFTFTGVTRGFNNTIPQSWPAFSIINYMLIKNTQTNILLNPAAVVKSIYTSPNWMMLYHANNYTTNINFAAALMGAFFINPKGLTVAKLQLNITPDVLSNNQLDQLNNIFITTYAGFSSSISVVSTVTGLVQYGYMVTSTTNTQYYLDQVYTSDYAELQIEADLTDYMLQTDIYDENGINSPLYYDDNGIQRLVTVIKQSLNKLVDDNMILPFKNNAIIYIPYSKVSSDDITNRVYNGITANIVFKSHIQKITLTINIKLV
jgi:hypothetical protein